MNVYSTALCLVAAYVLQSGIVTGSALAQSADPQSSGAIDVNPIGKVMSLTGKARVEHAAAVVVQASLPAGDVADAKIGDLVYRGDMVQTGVGSSLGITFVDGSTFRLSANSRMELNEFVYDPHSNSNSTLISLSEGTFSFIAGQIARSGDMKIDTPVGVMGIRGTAPRIEVRKDGSVKFTTMIEEK